jgi:hypothetical protein
MPPYQKKSPATDNFRYNQSDREDAAMGQTSSMNIANYSRIPVQRKVFQVLTAGGNFSLICPGSR